MKMISDLQIGTTAFYLSRLVVIIVGMFLVEPYFNLSTDFMKLFFGVMMMTFGLCSMLLDKPKVVKELLKNG